MQLCLLFLFENMQGRVEVQVHSFLTSVYGHLYAPAALPQGNNPQVPIWWETESQSRCKRLGKARISFTGR